MAEDKRLRIGMISPGLCTGGVERWWLSLCRLWAQSTELKVSGVALTDGAYAEQTAVDEAAHYCPVYGSKVRDISLGMNAERNIERFDDGYAAVHALKQNSDVLIVWGHDNISTYIYDFKGPVVMVAHGSGSWTEKRMSHAAYYCTHFAAVSDACRKAYPIDLRSNVKVILNGIELDRCVPTRARAEIRAEWGLKETDRAVGYIGRYSVEKVPLAAARAVSVMSDNTVAVYVGPDFGKKDVQAEIKAIAGSACRFVIPTHVGDAFAGLDVLLVTSSEEGCCLVLLEAMAAGLPAVVTRVGAVPELELTHGPLFQSVPVSAGNDVLASAINQALLPRVRSRTVYAQQIAFRHLSASRMAQEWRDYLLSLPCPAVKPTVAVGIICHNYGRYLAEAIESVLAQSHMVDEIIVVDDGSTDNTAMVARGYIARGVKYTRVEMGNAYGSRGAAFESTTANVLCFLDADDKLPVDYMEKGLALFENSQVGIVYCDLVHFGADNGRVITRPTDEINLWVVNDCCASCLVRRDALESGAVFKNWRMRRGKGDYPAADWIIFRAVLDAGWKLAYNPARLLYRRHSQSLTMTLYREKSYYDLADLGRVSVSFLVVPRSSAAWCVARLFLERQQWRNAQVRLVICVDERDTDLANEVQCWLANCWYTDYRQVSHGIDLSNDAVAALVYNQLIREMPTEYVLLLDGTESPPSDIVEQYFRKYQAFVAIRTHVFPNFTRCGLVRKSVVSQFVLFGEGFELKVINQINKTYNSDRTYWAIDLDPLT